MKFQSHQTHQLGTDKINTWYPDILAGTFQVLVITSAVEVGKFITSTMDSEYGLHALPRGKC